MFSQSFLNGWVRLDEGRALHVARSLVVGEGYHARSGKRDCGHMWERFHECGICRDHDEILLSALIKDPRVALVLNIDVIMHNYVQSRLSKLLGQVDGP